MRRTHTARRAVAAAAGVLVGAAGAIALAAPAQAQEEEEKEIRPLPPDVEFLDTCSDAYVALHSGGAPVTFEVTAGGEVVWPTGGDGTLEPDSVRAVPVPVDAGEIEVSHDHSDYQEGWPRQHTWERPAECEELPAPEYTEATCDEDATIAIPEQIGFLPRDGREASTLGLTEAGESRGDEPSVGYFLDGDPEPLDPGSTQEVDAEPHTVVLGIYLGDVSAGLDMLVLDRWTFETELDCEDDEGGEGGSAEEELPDTGATTLLIAGGAAVLLALGGGLHVAARRRRAVFTA